MKNEFKTDMFQVDTFFWSRQRNERHFLQGELTVKSPRCLLWNNRERNVSCFLKDLQLKLFSRRESILPSHLFTKKLYVWLSFFRVLNYFTVMPLWMQVSELSHLQWDSNSWEHERKIFSNDLNCGLEFNSDFFILV